VKIFNFASLKENQSNIMSSFIEYIKESKSELSHVSWPTRSQAAGFTILVIVLSVATALYLGAFDTLFTSLIAKFIVR
jgi:preprotein translocase SecE subunit